MATPASGADALPAASGDAGRALARLRIALVLFASAGMVGGPWDMLYHITNPFDSFLSPPHLFIYGTTLASMVVVASIAVSPSLRSSFGKGVSLPLLPVAVPGPLIILGGGLLIIAVAGVLDEIWHSAFQLDETRWSTPHAMFGWGLLLLGLGFASARIALRSWRPLAEPAQVAYALLLVAFSLYAVLLPFMVYPTRATLDAIAALPVIQAQPDAGHTLRIYRAWSIDHANPCFAPLAALWAGLAIALSRALAPRPRTLLVVTALASSIYALAWYAFAARLGTAADPRSWLPLPVLLALAVVLFPSGRWDPRILWAIAGAAFGGTVVAIWGSPTLAPVSAVLSAPAMAAGGWTGMRIARAVEAPNLQALRLLLPGMGLLVPALFGMLDLYLRLNTP